jgi:hypothetical protein
MSLAVTVESRKEVLQEEMGSDIIARWLDMYVAEVAVVAVTRRVVALQTLSS